MSLLGQVTRGKISVPDFVIPYGTDGVGKSTFAAQAPKVIFIGPEKGTANLDVARYPKEPKTFEDVMGAVQDLTANPHDFQSLAVDSLDHIEPLVWDKVCREAGASNIEQAYGGYGKGYVAANKLWLEMIQALIGLREKRKMNIIAIAHSMVKAFNDPQTNATYDRFQLKLNEKASALWRESADCVFFCNFEVYTKQDQQTKKTRAFGEGVRMMYTERRPGFDAKNRMALPASLPLDWNAYIAAKSGATPNAPEVILNQIAELKALIQDEALKAKVEETLTKAGNDASKLMPILNRLRTLLNA
jgi:hypothetical protein